MPEPPESNKTSRERINLRDFADHGAFEPPPKFFDQRASLSIAKWILYIFAGVLALAFVVLIILLFDRNADRFDKVAELLKFMIQSVVPLVTLAVGYYLGDRSRGGNQNE